jgi:hypothetical protein
MRGCFSGLSLRDVNVPSDDKMPQNLQRKKERKNV